MASLPSVRNMADSLRGEVRRLRPGSGAWVFERLLRQRQPKHYVAFCSDFLPHALTRVRAVWSGPGQESHDNSVGSSTAAFTRAERLHRVVALVEVEQLPQRAAARAASARSGSGHPARPRKISIARLSRII